MIFTGRLLLDRSWVPLCVMTGGFFVIFFTAVIMLTLECRCFCFFYLFFLAQDTCLLFCQMKDTALMREWWFVSLHHFLLSKNCHLIYVKQTNTNWSDLPGAFLLGACRLLYRSVLVFANHAKNHNGTYQNTWEIQLCLKERKKNSFVLS